MGLVIETDKINALPGGAKRCYHAVTKDWITNEIFRRVEPKRRTMGQYFREELMKQGEMDIMINMEEDELFRVA